MSKGWTIGGSPRREAARPCFNENCSSCDVRTGCCRIDCFVCSSRVAESAPTEGDDV